MERGLYIAAAGMAAEQVRQDLIANDLANVQTPGYKPDRASQHEFASVLLANRSTGGVIGALGAGPEVARVTTDLSPAAIRDTGEPLDLAIDGPGFFAVRTAAGVRYTRNGQFTVSAQGTLVDQLGREVLSAGGGPVRVRADGTVDPAQVALRELRGVRKAGENLYTGTPAGAAAGRVRTGALETSGVDPTRAMVEMVQSLRSYEAAQKAITTIDETLGRAASQVGSVTGG